MHALRPIAVALGLFALPSVAAACPWHGEDGVHYTSGLQALYGDLQVAPQLPTAAERAAEWLARLAESRARFTKTAQATQATPVAATPDTASPGTTAPGTTAPGTTQPGTAAADTAAEKAVPAATNAAEQPKLP